MSEQSQSQQPTTADRHQSGANISTSPQQEPQQRPPQAERPKALKLVVRLDPSSDGYSATIGVSQEGCDPRFRSLRAEDLTEVLDTVPGFLESARRVAGTSHVSSHCRAKQRPTTETHTHSRGKPAR